MTVAQGAGLLIAVATHVARVAGLTLACVTYEEVAFLPPNAGLRAA